MADRILPRVELLFRCAEIRHNRTTNLYTIIHPGVSTIQMPPGQTENAVLENVWVFAQVLDGVGEFYLSIEVRNESGLRVVRGRRASHLFGINERLFAKQIAFYLPEVPFEKPGVYRICLLAGEAELENGFIDLRVLPGLSL